MRSVVVEPNIIEDHILCIVALENKSPREYKNYYLAIRGTKEEAQLMQTAIAKNGFKSDERRFFPDEIESLTIKLRNDNE